MANTYRDNFSKLTVLQIAKRAGWLCSYPTCRRPTVGATSDGEGEINIGTAAHICAAAPGGPRYDEKMTSAERKLASNGMWMCRDHGKAIDSVDPQFTVEKLREWKRQAEMDSWRRVLRHEELYDPEKITDTELHARVRLAAKDDLSVFSRTAKWPATSVELALEVEGFDEPFTTSALSRAVTSLDDLILIAPPGMGKTTTLFQIAKAMLANEEGSPFILPLGDWATENVSLLDSILKRPAFRYLSESDIRSAASQGGVVLMLDGWNELDIDARKRARVQVNALKAELPKLGLIVSTRRQVLDIPFGGAHVELLSLNEEQQMRIASELRGEVGKKLVDQAWRTGGIRELVSIPLYLTSLLTLPDDESFPNTKEEVLRLFVARYEKDAGHAEVLHSIMHGFQKEFLKDLATLAIRTANTAITDQEARQSIFETENALAANGQMTIKPQPESILEALVSDHILMRLGGLSGYSFQHHQFQEWYASYLVEERIVAEAGDLNWRGALQAEVFNLPAFEEPILFAIERLARGNQSQVEACGEAIIAAFEVDPILAAEMIYRSSEDVWSLISSEIQEKVMKWHASGRVDRALRFMLTTGRSEFHEQVWPLITNDNDQISLRALRNCNRFRSSILGSDAEKMIIELPQHARQVLLAEMAYNSGIDGIHLASHMAKDDPDPEVQASVVDMLAFRRADRHVISVLQNASDETFDILAQKGLVDEVDDEQVSKGIAEARERIASNSSVYQQLRSIWNARDDVDRSAELSEIISTMEIDKGRDEGANLIYELRHRYLRAISDGLLSRLRNGRTLFYGADDILASAKMSLEDDALLEIALSEGADRDAYAEAAASVLGPIAANCMIDALFDVKSKLRDENGKYVKTASDRYHAIRLRIAHLNGKSLVLAVQTRSDSASNEQMAEMADLLARHSSGDDLKSRSYDAEDLANIRALAQDWGQRMLVSGDYERRHLAEIARLVSCVPDVSLLPLLKQMLDENLQQYRSFRKDAVAARWIPCKAVTEAQHPMMHEYQRAFLAIDAPECAEMMREYLPDFHFGELAALVLTSQWFAINEPLPDKQLFAGVEFSQVMEKRMKHYIDLEATSEEAEAIFSVIEPLLVEGATDDQKKHAATLGIVAVRLPHGRRDVVIDKLISITPRRIRSRLLLNLILSGEEVETSVVADGIAETFEAAKTQQWILTQSDGYELREWMRLLPFTTCLADMIEIVRNLSEEHRSAKLLEEIVNGLPDSPSEDAEDILFKLAQEYPHLYGNYQWKSAVLRIGTESAAHQLIELAMNGVFNSKSSDTWHWSRELGTLVADYPGVRKQVYDLIKNNSTGRDLDLLIGAISEHLDDEGLLLLVGLEQHKKGFMLGGRTIENVVTEQVPVEGWSDSYNIVPVPAIKLRKQLLSMTKGGGQNDTAAYCLNIIDTIRDEYGLPMTEPRHPDLSSGKSWPLLIPEQDSAF